jgi:hypothetical protein
MHEEYYVHITHIEKVSLFKKTVKTSPNFESILNQRFYYLNMFFYQYNVSHTMSFSVIVVSFYVFVDQ